MYASIREYNVGAGAAGEVARRASEGIAPLVSGVDGFVAYYAVDLGSGTVSAVSIFRDRAGADEADRRVAEWASANLGSSQTSVAGVTGGEVVANLESASTAPDRR